MVDLFAQAVFVLARITPQGGESLGTCFLLNKSGHFATALHATEQSDQGLIIYGPTVEKLNDYQNASLEEHAYYEVEIVAADPIRDLCILKLKNDISNSLNLVITGTDNVRVGESVYMVGFPHATDNRSILTCQNTSVGAKTLMSSAGVDFKSMVINTQTSSGQSGSPVFKVSNNELVGIVTGTYDSPSAGIRFGRISPGAINQTTFAVSAEYLRNMY